MAKQSVKEHLVDWTITYLKSRDAISKSIQTIEANKEGADVYVTFKDCQLAIIIEPFLKDTAFIGRLMPFKEKGIKIRLVTTNSKESLNVIIGNWKLISEFDKEFNILFVNPFSKLERKWMIYPQTHAGIAGKGFERGLKALFATVEPITEQEFQSLL